MIFITLLRVLLLPFSVLYGIIVSIRNVLFDVNILKSTSFKIPLITVGNLSVGGTGKTPQIEYLIRLLENEHQITVLSRGYKRKSKGFVLADENTTVLDLGDEPYQYYKKFSEINVAVDGNRVEGVSNILNKKPNTDVILLDDAYQHRKIKAGYHILLTAYSDLFYKDFMMPTGNLRELWWGKNRANDIIVTKCPEDLSEEEQTKIINKIKPNKDQNVYFTKIAYGDKVFGTKELYLDEFVKTKIVVVTGIAKPKPLLNFLTKIGATFEHLEFQDHHNFTKSDLDKIKLMSKTAKILTTEKDYVRLENEVNELYYLTIETQFLNHKKAFDTKVLRFVSKANKF